MMVPRIRLVCNDDHTAIRALTQAAFTASELGYHGEAELVDQIRGHSPSPLELVAYDTERIIGHILFSPVEIRIPGSQFLGMGLAPMAVLPETQNCGVGTALIREGSRRIFSAGTSFIVVLGHPEYYPRFGFQVAANLGIHHGFTGIPQDVFFIRCKPFFDGSQLSGGRAFYGLPFGPQFNDDEKAET